MESTNVEPQEPLLNVDQTETSSKLKQADSPPQTPFPPSDTGSKRPYRDSAFTFLFLTTILTTFTLGIFASTRTDTLNMDTKLSLSHFNPTTNKCEITQQQAPEDPDSDSAFVTLAAIASLSALSLTLPVSLFLFFLLRRYTHTMLLLSAPLIPLVPLGCLVLLFSWCLDVHEGCAAALRSKSTHIILVVYLLELSALFGYELWRNWTGSAAENGVQVLSMATGALKELFVLLVVNPVLMMGWMVLVNGPILGFMWYAFNVGEVVPDFDVVRDPNKRCELGIGGSCCRKERPGWVYAYIIFASLTAFWVLMVSIALQHLVVSGTVSHRYFAPAGSSTIGNIKRSLRNAYGPSFGTACNLGTVVTTLVVELVGLLKKIGDQVLESNPQGMMASVLRRCFSRISQTPKCDPQLASQFAGILGDSFWESSKKSHNLFLRTSLLSIIGTNFHFLAIHALMGMTFTCTLLQTLVVYGVLEYFSTAASSTKLTIAALCFPITMIGLGSGFFQAVSSVITTVYICYAMEKDVGEISKPEVCRAFMSTAPSSPENGAQVIAASVNGI